MVAAKFFVIGDVEAAKEHITKERLAEFNLDGSVVTIRPNKMVVVLEGDEANIRKFYAKLKSEDSSLVYTNIYFGRPYVHLGKEEEDEESKIIRLLREIRRELQSLNTKVDKLLEKEGKEEEEKSQTTSEEGTIADFFQSFSG